LQLGDMPRDVVAGDRLIVEVRDDARLLAAQSGREQGHAVEFVVCVAVSEICRVAMHSDID
jgi:hypothetical protein